MLINVDVLVSCCGNDLTIIITDGQTFLFYPDLKFLIKECSMHVLLYIL